MFSTLPNTPKPSLISHTNYFLRSLLLGNSPNHQKFQNNIISPLLQTMFQTMFHPDTLMKLRRNSWPYKPGHFRARQGLKKKKPILLA